MSTTPTPTHPQEPPPPHSAAPPPALAKATPGSNAPAAIEDPSRASTAAPNQVPTTATDVSDAAGVAGVAGVADATATTPDVVIGPPLPPQGLAEAEIIVLKASPEAAATTAVAPAAAAATAPDNSTAPATTNSDTGVASSFNAAITPATTAAAAAAAPPKPKTVNPPGRSTAINVAPDLNAKDGSPLYVSNHPVRKIANGKLKVNRETYLMVLDHIRRLTQVPSCPCLGAGGPGRVFTLCTCLHALRPDPKTGRDPTVLRMVASHVCYFGGLSQESRRLLEMEWIKSSLRIQRFIGPNSPCFHLPVRTTLEFEQNMDPVNPPANFVQKQAKVNEVPVCGNAFKLVYGLGRERFRSSKKHATDNTLLIHGLKGKKGNRRSKKAIEEAAAQQRAQASATEGTNGMGGIAAVSETIVPTTNGGQDDDDDGDIDHGAELLHTQQPHPSAGQIHHPLPEPVGISIAPAGGVQMQIHPHLSYPHHPYVPHQFHQQQHPNPDRAPAQVPLTSHQVVGQTLDDIHRNRQKSGVMGP